MSRARKAGANEELFHFYELFPLHFYTLICLQSALFSNFSLSLCASHVFSLSNNQISIRLARSAGQAGKPGSRQSCKLAKTELESNTTHGRRENQSVVSNASTDAGNKQRGVYATHCNGTHFGFLQACGSLCPAELPRWTPLCHVCLASPGQQLMRREYATRTGDLRPQIHVIIINARGPCSVCIAAPSLSLHPLSPYSLACLPQAVLMCGLAVVERLATASSLRVSLWFCVATVSRRFRRPRSPAPPCPLTLLHPSRSLPSAVFWAEKSKFQHAQIVWHFITWNVDAEAVEMIEIE